MTGLLFVAYVAYCGGVAVSINRGALYLWDGSSEWDAVLYLLHTLLWPVSFAGALGGHVAARLLPEAVDP